MWTLVVIVIGFFVARPLGKAIVRAWMNSGSAARQALASPTRTIRDPGLRYTIQVPNDWASLELKKPDRQRWAVAASAAGLPTLGLAAFPVEYKTLGEDWMLAGALQAVSNATKRDMWWQERRGEDWLLIAMDYTSPSASDRRVASISAHTIRNGHRLQLSITGWPEQYEDLRLLLNRTLESLVFELPTGFIPVDDESPIGTPSR